LISTILNHDTLSGWKKAFDYFSLLSSVLATSEFARMFRLLQP